LAIGPFIRNGQRQTNSGRFLEGRVKVVQGSG